MMQTLDFAISDEYRFDPQSGRYRYTKAPNKGAFVSRDAMLSLTRANLDQQKIELVKLADKLAAGQVTLKQFQIDVAHLVRRIHIQQAVLGHGGIDRMKPQDWLLVARELKRQYKDGKDPETGKPFGLKWLSQDLASGKLSAAALKNRLGMFAEAGIVSYWRGFTLQGSRDADKPYAIRELGSVEHCPECIDFAAMPPQAVSDVVMPTQRCRCRARCRCSIVLLNLEEAIARGMRV